MSDPSSTFAMGSDSSFVGSDSSFPGTEGDGPRWTGSLRFLNKALRANPFDALEIAEKKLGDFLNDPTAEDFVARIQAVFQVIQHAVRLDCDASLATLLLPSSPKEEAIAVAGFSTRHLVDTAVICEAVALQTDQHPSVRTSIGCAALTMNIAMLEFQDVLQQQKGELTPDQRQVVTKHPECGVEMLRNAGVLDDLWLQGVLTHHEVHDGNGYPKGLSGADIPISGQYVHLADMYCARQRQRAFRQSEKSNETLSDILYRLGKSVDPTLGAHFIKAVGIFPPGNVVQIASGEIGLVIRKGQNSATPQVIAIARNDGIALPAPIRRDTTNPRFAVKTLMRREDLQAPFNALALWGWLGTGAPHSG